MKSFQVWPFKLTHSMSLAIILVSLVSKASAVNWCYGSAYGYPPQSVYCGAWYQYCVKIIDSSGAESYGCDTNRYCSYYGNGGPYSSSAYNQFVYYCCNTDNCNSSPSILSNTASTIALSVATLLLRFLF